VHEGVGIRMAVERVTGRQSALAMLTDGLGSGGRSALTSGTSSAVSFSIACDTLPATGLAMHPAAPKARARTVAAAPP